MRNDDKIYWDEFNETEQQAIAIHFDNMANGTEKPTFPCSAAAFEELAETLASLAKIMPNHAAQMAKELQAINNVLLRQMPVPKTRNRDELGEIYTDEQIKQNLLGCNVGFFLVKQFNNIINQIAFTLEAEKTGGGNGTKH